MSCLFNFPSQGLGINPAAYFEAMEIVVKLYIEESYSRKAMHISVDSTSSYTLAQRKSKEYFHDNVAPTISLPSLPDLNALNSKDRGIVERETNKYVLSHYQWFVDACYMRCRGQHE